MVYNFTAMQGEITFCVTKIIVFSVYLLFPYYL